MRHSSNWTAIVQISRSMVFVSNCLMFDSYVYSLGDFGISILGLVWFGVVVLFGTGVVWDYLRREDKFWDFLFHVWSNCSWRKLRKLVFTIWCHDNFIGLQQFCHFGQHNTTRGQQKIGEHLPFITQLQNWVGKPSEGFAVQRQEGERNFAIALAFTNLYERWIW